MEDSTKRFDNRADVYAKGRPGYAPELIGRLFAWAGLGPASTIADIGAGTGIFSAQLAATGARVVAVEPNDGMRAQAERLAAREPRIEVVSGTAEATGIASASVDLVTAAQAFHWFDTAAFRAECMRMLRPPSRVALVWNVRVPDAPVNIACEQVFRALCPRFQGFSGGFTRDDPRIAAFFSDAHELWVFDNPLIYTRERFIDRCLSGSYAPRPGDESYRAFVDEVTAIFDAHRQGDSIIVPNETLAYAGELTIA